MINAGDDEVIPRRCTEKLADALGIGDQVVWFKGLGHYTAMAELPTALRRTADFFAQDLPVDVATPAQKQTPDAATPVERLTSVVQQAVTILTTEPEQDCYHVADLELSQFVSGRVKIVHGSHGKFAVRGVLPYVGSFAFGQGRFPWLVAGEKDKRVAMVGTKKPITNENPLQYADPRDMTKVRTAKGLADGLALVPEVLLRWIDLQGHRIERPENSDNAGQNADYELQGKLADSKDPLSHYAVHLQFRNDGKTPTEGSIDAKTSDGAADFSFVKIKFRRWQLNVPADDAMFDPPANLKQQEVDPDDLHHIFSATLNFALEQLSKPTHSNVNLKDTATTVVARDPAGHGLLCRSQGKTIIVVSGTPAEMGAAQGSLLREPAHKLVDRTVYFVGGGDTLRSGTWFFDHMANIERRTTPHIPQRFLDECDAFSKAAGLSQHVGRMANLFPERFHCSGVALKGKATAGRTRAARPSARLYDGSRSATKRRGAGVLARGASCMDEHRLCGIRRLGYRDE